jgi:hypothetical protein
LFKEHSQNGTQEEAKACEGMVRREVRMRPEGLDGGEGKDEGVPFEAAMEEVGGECGVGAGEGGVVVEREVGGARLVLRGVGRGLGWVGV